jgi:spore coat polysaccharide biosynthesis protein SpsF
MKIVAIIQARMGSTRLPGKVLMDIAGTTMLDHVCSRTAQSESVDEVVVATSTRSHDDAITKECERLGVACFRGSENDVLDRYFKAAKSCGASVVARITSDCPLIDAQIVDRIIRELIAANADYSSNTISRTYPRGLDAEAMKIEALESAWKNADQPFQREHVTPYIYQNPSLFALHPVTIDDDHSSLRWTVDTIEDLEFVRSVFEHLGSSLNVSWTDVMRLLNENPEIAALNSHIEQKGLED